ncbi:MAG: response regulator [Clostridiales Family XIII bacterium]|nr:response regulator [Clostridiales Family XIII bacterium]
MVMVIGASSAMVLLIARIVSGAASQLLFMIAVIVLFLIITIVVSNKFKLHHIVNWIIIIALPTILFPLAFFALGGVNSSVPIYFALAFMVLFLLAHGKSRLILACITLAVDIFVYYLGRKYPELVAQQNTNQLYADHIASFIVIAICIGLVILFQNRILKSEIQKVERSREELRHKDDLLQIVNVAAAQLLSSDANAFDEMMRRGMESMAHSINVGRINIWRNIEHNGAPHYYLAFQWEHSENNCVDPHYFEKTHLYSATLPRWREVLSEDQLINAPVAELQNSEKEILEPFGVKSLLVVPVFLQNAFWGFVSFDDCKNHRYFSEAEASVLRSGALLLANALERNGNALILRDRLKQQELMSEISNSFISNESMGDIIHGALRKAGEFLGVTRLLLTDADSASDETFARYSWAVSDDWLPKEKQTGLKAFVAGSFPQQIPEGTYVTPICINDAAHDEDGKYAFMEEKVHLHSFVWAPLYISGKYWGMISVEECIGYRDWTLSDTQLISVVSSFIAGAVARDIMEKARASALDQAVRASEAKSNFLSNMSHEMRTPMNAIIGMTTIGRLTDDIGKKEHSLEKIQEASTHLLGVINDILDMSKIEANKLDLSEAPFNFEKTLQKVVNVAGYRIEEKNQRFHVKVDSRIPRTLIGDDQRLSQVITNLLSNAVKFTPECGAIRLDTNLVSEIDGICTIKISVSDTGIGITDEQKSRLFTSFEQAEAGTSRKFGGTGLGLAISKRIVELMGGKIGLESELGKGSTFAFSIKMKRGVGTSAPLLGPNVNWTNIRILAVDDEQETVDYFLDLAHRLGISCSVATSGKEALEVIEREGLFNIYFLDLKMPGMDGIQLASEIRKIDCDNSVITMISSADWQAIETEAKAAGVDRFLPKPLFPSVIADYINECMGTQVTKQDVSKTESAGTFEGYTVLLAEDIEINREIVLSLLEPTLITIDTAVDGKTALAKFIANQDRYDVIFMDVQMPEMDGLDATRRIRALGTKKAESIPIVAMTANVFREDIEKCLAAGMNDHIGKPIDLEEVIGKLHTYLPMHARSAD